MLVETKNKISRIILDTNPLYPTLIYSLFVWAVVISAIYFRITLIFTAYPTFFYLLSMFIIFVPIGLTCYRIINLRLSFYSYLRLLSLFIHIIVLFGTTYFLMQTALIKEDPKGKSIDYELIGKTPISGISNKWVKQLEIPGTDKSDIVKNALTSYFDCIHFSLVTSSTVGYGDMVPTTTRARALVDLQIIFSFVIVVLGVGIFITNAENKEARQLKSSLILSSEDIENADLHTLNTYKLLLELRINKLSKTLNKVDSEIKGRGSD